MATFDIVLGSRLYSSSSSCAGFYKSKRSTTINLENCTNTNNVIYTLTFISLSTTAVLKLAEHIKKGYRRMIQ